MRALLRKLLVLAAVLASASAIAQTPQRIEMGQVTSGKAVGDGGSFYAFAGAMGTRLKVYLVVEGLAAVVLYDADGKELAAQQDNYGGILQHTLEEDGIYLIGISSARTDVPYTVLVEGQVPRIELVYDDEPAAAATDALTASSATAAITAVPAPAATSAEAKPAVFTGDPAVWGLYTRLVGRRTQAPEGRYRIVWRWQDPGKVLLEDWEDASGKVRYSNTITPTGEPGGIQMHTKYLGGKDWDGRIDADGNIHYIGKGLLKLPYRISLAEGDVFEMRREQNRGGQVVVQPAQKYARWEMEAAAP
ncbi:hypothetical protein [Pseudoxanthomonas indica]|uniref:Uncharacterized protein n=1 Tax=Pseudoxanthomonas indica TaxID=428993 RepID=A0A1T5KAI3_9GAMM|nr:hypothetical protein [Pseudoxanthomonas indica]GGD47824.1 hypothetical protein GCM10007235_19640 [Pseudoxanthomonas indica]SKC60485.1 hypothetical protein SAMN06296058_1505 [Pseudoxanthomonas indica]